MTCANCDQAALQPWWPRFTATCYGCAARELAQSPGYFFSVQAGRFRDDYAAQLRATYGPTKADLEAGHRQVKAAARALVQPRLIA